MASPEYVLLTKIAYAVMLLSLLGVVFGGVATSFLDLELQVGEFNQDRYRKMVILQNMMNLDLTQSQIEEITSDDPNLRSYRYQRQTSIIPMEIFQESNEGNEQVGYDKNGEHCYMDEVPLLDGENYGYYLTVLPKDYSFESPRSLGCVGRPSSARDSVSSPALIVRKANNTPPLPVRVSVYELP